LTMADAGTAPPTMMKAAAPAERIAPRRLIAFLIMVFGMFMSILDIQIVSASLTDIQAGLSASSTEVSWVQTAYLIAEVIAIPLSGFLSRALGTRLGLAARLYAGIAGGDDPAAKQRQIYLQGADPLERLGNPFLRSRGSLLEGQDVHYQEPGGGGVRGLDPRVSTVALVALNLELERDYATTVTVRTGVNTGQVVTGTEERLATGDAVNLAARLEQAAAPGENVG